MYSEFRTLLDNATGKQQFVIAVNLDIRGFSAFSMSVESPETAEFIKTVYAKLIDGYFTNAPFIKPTGDGLLIVIPIIPYTGENLKKIAAETISACLKALEDFGSFCDREPTIYFKSRVPRTIGIGLSMGSVCRLVSDDKTLDYSGRALNLASRLMDVARPSGIVFDANLEELLPDKLKEHFSKDSVYLHGIAERRPIEVYYSKECTAIPPAYKRPLAIQEWVTEEFGTTLEKLRILAAQGQSLLISLDYVPVDPDQISVKIWYPKSIVKKLGINWLRLAKEQSFRYRLAEGEPVIEFNCDKIIKTLERDGMSSEEEVNMKIRYPK